MCHASIQGGAPFGAFILQVSLWEVMFVARGRQANGQWEIEDIDVSNVRQKKTRHRCLENPKANETMGQRCLLIPGQRTSMSKMSHLFLDIDVFRFFLEFFLFYHFKPCLSLSFGQHCLNRPTFDNVCEN